MSSDLPNRLRIEGKTRADRDERNESSAGRVTRQVAGCSHRAAGQGEGTDSATRRIERRAPRTADGQDRKGLRVRDAKASLPDLFDSRRQLIVRHFMFDPSWDDGCPSCTAGADEISDGLLEHLHTRDTSASASNSRVWRVLRPMRLSRPRSARRRRRLGREMLPLVCLASLEVPEQLHLMCGRESAAGSLDVVTRNPIITGEWSNCQCGCSEAGPNTSKRSPLAASATTKSLRSCFTSSPRTSTAKLRIGSNSGASVPTQWMPRTFHVLSIEVVLLISAGRGW
jgi:hypothetical protein